MRVRLVLVLGAACLLVAASADAKLPSATTPGVTVSKGRDGRMTIGFAATRAGARAYRPYAGRRATIRCVRVGGGRPIGAGPPPAVTNRIRMAKRRSAIRLRRTRGVNLCSLSSASQGFYIALDVRARRVLADVVSGLALIDAADDVRAHGSAATLRRLGPSGVRLEGPGASPPRHRIGIYGDRGGPVAAVTVSESARRLFIETNGEVTRTNVLGPLEQVANGYLARGVLLPTGPRPEPGTPLPATSDPEITARREGAGAAIEFAGGAAAAVAGRQIHVECTRRTTGHTFTPAERYSWSGRSPRAGRPLRLPVPSAYHLCGVAFSGRLARVALDDTGRVELEEGTVAIALTRVLRAAGAAAGRGYPTAQAIADRLGGAVAVLGVSTDEPPDLRIGAWSDGARRLVLSAIARTGRRMFIQIDGDIVTANDIDLPILPDP